MDCFKKACRLAFAATFAVLGFATGAYATDPYTLPTIGVDMPGVVTALGTYVAAIVVAIVGVSMAFQGVRIGMRWIRSQVK